MMLKYRIQMSNLVSSTDSSLCITDTESNATTTTILASAAYQGRSFDVKPWPHQDSDAMAGAILSLPEQDKFTRLGLIDSTQFATQKTALEVAIKAGRISEVEGILDEFSHEVDITPRFGCSPLHYTKLNLVNYCEDHEDSPLITAARTNNSGMVGLLVRYGANPNHANKRGETPLSVVAHWGEPNSVVELLRGGANLTVAVIKVLSLIKGLAGDDSSDSLDNIKALHLLVCEGAFLWCKDPIRSSFEVGRRIAHLLAMKPEFRFELEQLIETADRFAYRFLDYSEKLYEAEQLILKKGGGSSNLLTKAIDNKKKRFISHPLAQQIIQKQWYGGIYNVIGSKRLRIIASYLSGPVTVPWATFHFLVRGDEAVLLDTLNVFYCPFWCFVTDLVNYVMLLGLLFAVCLVPQVSPSPGPVEWMLWLCTLSRVLIEMEQLLVHGSRRYLGNVWNHVELLTCAVISISATVKISIWLAGAPGKYLLYVAYLNATAEFMFILRGLNFIEVSSSLGPLMLAMKSMMVEVLKFFLVILMTVVVGATMAIYSVSLTVAHSNSSTNSSKELPQYFNSFERTLESVMWSTFGLLDMPDIEIFGDSTTTSVIDVILVLYVIIACVMMLNMLIAMLNITYQRIQDNCDVEWKYAKAEMLKEYSNGQPFLFPFHLVIFPFNFWFRKMVTRSRAWNSSEDEVNSPRTQLVSRICDRLLVEKSSGSHSCPKLYKGGCGSMCCRGDCCRSSLDSRI